MICENHTLPNLLTYARNFHTDKIVADTLVAGFLIVFEAKTLGSAAKLFENIAIVHCSKAISKEVRENIKAMEFNNPEDTLCDFVGDFDNKVSEEHYLQGYRK